MTRNEKDLIALLLQEDHYMAKAINSKGKEVYKVFKGRQIPVQYFSIITVNKVKDFLKIDHKKRMTLNLNIVRQLHGKNYIKMLYNKKHKSIKDT